jgi:hypothetical protein
MNNTNKSVNQNGKNTLTIDLNNIPNTNGRNYAIQLKTSDEEMTNILYSVRKINKSNAKYF